MNSTNNSNCPDRFFGGLVGFDRTDTVTLHEEWYDIAFHGVGLLCSLCSFALLVCVPPRKNEVHPWVLRLSLIAALVSATIASALTGRVFELLVCDGKSMIEHWVVVAVASSAFTSTVVLMLSRRYAMIAVSCAFSIAAWGLFADWALRGGFFTTFAAQPLVACINLWCIQGVSLFAHMLHMSHPSERKPLKTVFEKFYVDVFDDKHQRKT